MKGRIALYIIDGDSFSFISFMPRPKYYSPTIDRFLVSVLYHEARRQKKPMTALTNALLETALRSSEGWRHAESALALKEDPPPCAQT
jgi:hypothetical protein